KENGISDGTNLDGEVTREQLATLLWRFAGKPTAGDATPGAQSFTDADEISDWAREAVAWAVSVGIINGYPDGGVNPSASATRAEVAAMIKRYIEN
ncbi:MAG: S-layer homology domain-containing protein, partial [Oscillospiraceae bacterium]|nr:S-layer homology domain-containing protein [Oscillospiraceae bacterium]